MIYCETSLCGSSEAHMPLPASSVERKAICPVRNLSHASQIQALLLWRIIPCASDCCGCSGGQVKGLFDFPNYDHQWTAL